MEAGFDVNDQDFFGRTPLHWACLSENSRTVEYLVDHGASLSIRTLTQKTPVHLCFPLMMYINNPEIVNRYPEAFFRRRSAIRPRESASLFQIRFEQGGHASAQRPGLLGSPHRGESGTKRFALL